MILSDNDKNILLKAHKEFPEFYKLYQRTVEESEYCASHIAHDIRNYVTALHGLLQLYSTSDTPDTAILAQFKAITNQLLVYLNETSEYRYSAQLSDQEEIDILDILWNIPDYMDECFEKEKDFASYSRNYRLELPYELPLLYGNFDRLKYAICSIVKNSVEATATDDEITITAIAENNHIIITVADNGFGIEKNDLPNILEPFFSTKKSHIGLGLNSAAQTIANHKGQLVIEPNTCGTTGGTLVTITLPYCVISQNETLHPTSEES